MSEDRQFISRSDAQLPLYVGVDLGGTNVKVGVVDDLGRPMSWVSIHTETQRGPDDAMGRMAQAVSQAIEKAGSKPNEIARVGLGSPGTMDVPAGLLLEPPNLPGWENYPIRDRLAERCGFAVSFVNDANAAAYGEYWVGSGRHMQSMVLFTLGTGIGCGVVVSDLLVEGEHSHGAECGHMIINFSDDAPMCPCGQRGHIEAYCSAKSVVRRTHEALDAGRKTSLTKRIAAGDELTPLMLSEEAEKGDELSLEIILETARYLGVGVVNMMHTIDPEGVVLGGAMTFGGHDHALGRRFLERIREEVRHRAFPVLAKNTTVDFAALGGDAGYIGAAGVARLHHRRGEKLTH